MRFCSVKTRTGPCTCHRGAGTRQRGGLKGGGLVNVDRKHLLLVFPFHKNTVVQCRTK